MKHISKILIGKYLSDKFPIQNGLKQGNCLKPLFFNFALEYAIRKVQENQVGLKLNATHQLLLYADDVNLLGVNTDAIKKNTETLIEVNKEVYPEANAGESKYMLLPRHQKSWPNNDINILGDPLKIWHGSDIWERQ
jgi:hypothetical protein